MLYSDKDFEYYDMHIKSYLWNPLTEEFELICLYQNKETAKILLGKVKGIENISRFEGGIVKYVQHNKDDNGNLLLDIICHMWRGRNPPPFFFYKHRKITSTIVGKIFQQSSENHCIFYNLGV